MKIKINLETINKFLFQYFLQVKRIFTIKNKSASATGARAVKGGQTTRSTDSISLSGWRMVRTKSSASSGRPRFIFQFAARIGLRIGFCPCSPWSSLGVGPLDAECREGGLKGCLRRGLRWDSTPGRPIPRRAAAAACSGGALLPASWPLSSWQPAWHSLGEDLSSPSRDSDLQRDYTSGIVARTAPVPPTHRFLP